MIFVVLLVAQIVMQHGPIIRKNGRVVNPTAVVLLVDISGKLLALGMTYSVVVVSMPSLNLINEV